jgi:CheY-like chemotaxis protein
MKHIIVVDDDPGILDIMEMIFSRAGYKVIAYSGPEPLMSNHFEHPAAIVLDKQLSGADGLEVCRYLKDQPSTRDIPIIMVSASMNIGELAAKAGANAFVEKPFKVKHLLEVVEQYV